jgi:hypothetical protein
MSLAIRGLTMFPPSAWTHLLVRVPHTLPGCVCRSRGAGARVSMLWTSDVRTLWQTHGLSLHCMPLPPGLAGCFEMRERERGMHAGARQRKKRLVLPAPQPARYRETRRSGRWVQGKPGSVTGNPT